VLAAGWLVLGYLCGSIPFGVLLTRWRLGVDVRKHGSGNIGATNVARVAGKGLGVFVLFLDAVKGAAPVLVTGFFAPGRPWLQAGVGLAAFFGHVFPVWLRFRGGKGVATALGVLAALVPAAAVTGLVVYGAVFALWRVSSIGSLLGAVSALTVASVSARSPAYVVLAGVLFALMLFTHRSNIRRLLRREERRV
jgi:glycerol-3-phosphate acyltransferase PlsY